MSKVKCQNCGRLVAVKRGATKRWCQSKHRTGRSTPSKVKAVCKGSGKEVAKLGKES
jgi:hypothetical protein